MEENVESSGPNERHEGKAFDADKPVNDLLQRPHGTDLAKIFKQVKVRETMQSPQVPVASNDASGATDVFSPLTSQRASDEQESTQIFQTLEANSASSVVYESLAPPHQQLDGGFTQLLRALSNENNDEVPIKTPAPMAQPLPERPGEFTRITSRSALRGAADRERQERAQQASEPSDRHARPQAAPVDHRQFIAKGQFLSSMAGIGTPSSVPVGQAISAVMPLSAPAIASPALQSQPPPQSDSKLQQYIPLLLIANLFAPLMLMMLVVLMLLRHR